MPAAAGDGGLEEPLRVYHAGGTVAVFTEAAKPAGPVSDAPPGIEITDRLCDPDGRAVHPYADIPLQTCRLARC